MKTQKDIKHMLASTTPTLKRDEAEFLWQRIESKIAMKAIPSPFFNMFTVSRMSIAALALILIVGAGGTTVAAQQARPGDVLFPVERALEEVRLALAVNDTSRAALQLEFAEERLAELRSLIEENSKDIISEITTEASSTIRFSGEADVFTDITIVSVEINDRKSSFRTESKNRNEIIEKIVQRYNLGENVVSAGLDFKVEDRASRVSDISNDNNDERVDESIKLLSSLVDDIDDYERKRFVNEVLNTLKVDSVTRIEIRDDEDDKRIEIRNGDERVRIREKDGEVRVDIKSDDDSDDRNEDSDEDEDDRNDDNSNEEAEERDLDDTTEDEDESEDESEDDQEEADSDSDDSSEDTDTETEESESNNEDDNGTEEVSTTTEKVNSIEVRVEDGEAEVRISYEGGDDRYTLPYVSRTSLISAIADKTDLSETIVEDNLELEIKD